MKMKWLPHVDQVLGKSHRLCVASDGDGAVHIGPAATAVACAVPSAHSGLPILTVGYADHGSTELPLHISTTNFRIL